MKTRWLLGSALLLGFQLCQGQSLPSMTCPQSEDGITGPAETNKIVANLRTQSFPELARIDLGTRTFHSQSDYFRTRFSLARFFFPAHMRYFIEVNPALFGQQPPTDGVCSVLAHELVHVVALSHGNRIRRLSLVRLLSKDFTEQFERKTDLEAIHRGYGDGLKDYRTWVYTHIPANKVREKRRNYFSPEEIEEIQRRLRENPSHLASWQKHAPVNIQELLKDPK